MNRLILLGTAVGVFTAGPAFALTMTPVTDNRGTSASASAGFDSQSDSESPDPGFPSFTSEVTAFAADGLDPFQAGDAIDNIFGSTANANARQFSEVNALSITGSGSANAGGSYGYAPGLVERTIGDVDTEPNGGFHASASSHVEILFSIDAAAEFNLSGFLSAGLILLEERVVLSGDFDSEIGNGVMSGAGISLYNTDTLASVYQTDVSNGSQTVDESGVIGPGNYTFSFGAIAGVNGDEPIFTLPDFAGDSDGVPIEAFPVNGFYPASAEFQNVALTLRAADKPIPEPMTTSLACMGLGALVLKTSRRRAN